MRKPLTVILAVILSAAPLSAQWYLFPGSASRKATVQQEQKTEPEPVTDTAALTTAAALTTTAAITTTAADTTFVPDIPEQIKISMVLPLSASAAKPSQAMFDFYSGAILAIKQEAERGQDIAVSVIDSKSANDRLKIGRALCENDIILYCDGDIKDVETNLPEGKCLVSPLGSVRGDSTIVRLTTPWQNQLDELSQWLKEDTLPDDEIVLLCENPLRIESDTLKYIKERLTEKGIAYRTAQDANEADAVEISGTRRFINVSGSDKYLFKQLQAASVLGERGIKTAFYSTSRIRNLRGIEDSRMLYNAGAHLVAQYAIDYNDSDCRNFVNEYRSIARTEPTRFSFHGYDTARYFIQACAKYGRNYRQKLQEFPYKGIQSKFVFKSDTDAAMTNTAAGRITYNSDLSCIYR